MPEPERLSPRPPAAPVDAAMEGAAVPVRIVRVDAGATVLAEDAVAAEEPLEIRVGFGPLDARERRTVSLTMRTPGHDRELAAGFLYTEGILDAPDDVLEIRLAGPDGRRNVVHVELHPHVEPDLGRLQRHFYTTSSCGVCGKSSLEALEVAADRPRLNGGPEVRAQTLVGLPGQLRAAQELFGKTGGLHGCALFASDGTLLAVREDVGRHNALDKLIGNQLLGDLLPLSERIILLSGRASFELMQKAFMAGAPIVAAVGAPSSLAVELAERFGITLVGWLRGDRFSIYSHPERVRTAV